MKIQIDTAKKTLRIEEPVGMDELMKKLKMLFPGGGWKEYTLEMAVIEVWKDPIVVPPHPQPYSPWEIPPHMPAVMYGVISVADTTTTYNVEC